MKHSRIAAGALVGLLAAPLGVGAASDQGALLRRAVNAPRPHVNVAPQFEAKNFVDRIDNPYLPLKPGVTLAYAGVKDGKPMSEKFVVTSGRKMIAGVNTQVIHDFVYQGTKLVEKTTDWFAQDKARNVWYFGEATKALNNGKWTSSGSWQAGVNGARAGIYAQAHPHVGDTYRQEFYDGHPGDTATVLALDQTITVPSGTYNNAEMTMEWAPDSAGIVDVKYSVPGIGVVEEHEAPNRDDVMRLISRR